MNDNIQDSNLFKNINNNIDNNVSKKPGISEDIILFKEEILKDIKQLESKISLKYDVQFTLYANKIKKIEGLIEQINQRIAYLSSEIITDKSMKDKIEKISNWNSKTDETLILYDVRLKNLGTKLTETIDKFDNLFLETVIYPGIIGPKARYKNFHEFIDFLIFNINQLLIFREKNTVDAKDYRFKTDSLISNLQMKLDYLSKNSRAFTSSSVKVSEKKMEQSIKVQFDDFRTQFTVFKNGQEEKIMNLVENYKKIESLEKDFEAFKANDKNIEQEKSKKYSSNNENVNLSKYKEKIKTNLNFDFNVNNATSVLKDYINGKITESEIKTRRKSVQMKETKNDNDNIIEKHTFTSNRKNDKKKESIKNNSNERIISFNYSSLSSVDENSDEKENQKGIKEVAKEKEKEKEKEMEGVKEKEKEKKKEKEEEKEKEKVKEKKKEDIKEKKKEEVKEKKKEEVKEKKKEEVKENERVKENEDIIVKEEEKEKVKKEEKEKEKEKDKDIDLECSKIIKENEEEKIKKNYEFQKHLMGVSGSDNNFIIREDKKSSKKTIDDSSIMKFTALSPRINQTKRNFFQNDKSNKISDIERRKPQKSSGFKRNNNNIDINFNTINNNNFKRTYYNRINNRYLESPVNSFVKINQYENTKDVKNIINIIKKESKENIVPIIPINKSIDKSTYISNMNSRNNIMIENYNNLIQNYSKTRYDSPKLKLKLSYKNNTKKNMKNNNSVISIYDNKNLINFDSADSFNFKRKWNNVKKIDGGERDIYL